MYGRKSVSNGKKGNSAHSTPHAEEDKPATGDHTSMKFTERVNLKRQ
jgi:hypothetical protein